MNACRPREEHRNAVYQVPHQRELPTTRGEKATGLVRSLHCHARTGLASPPKPRCGVPSRSRLAQGLALCCVRRTPGISCEAVPACDRDGAGMRRHVHSGNHAAESFVSFIPLFGGAHSILHYANPASALVNSSATDPTPAAPHRAQHKAGRARRARTARPDRDPSELLPPAKAHPGIHDIGYEHLSRRIDRDAEGG